MTSLSFHGISFVGRWSNRWSLKTNSQKGAFKKGIWIPSWHLIKTKNCKYFKSDSIVWMKMNEIKLKHKKISSKAFYFRDLTYSDFTICSLMMRNCSSHAINSQIDSRILLSFRHSSPKWFHFYDDDVNADKMKNCRKVLWK